MRHTLSIVSSKQIKSQKLHQVQFLNVKPGSIVKIEQNKNLIYAHIAQQENNQNYGSKKQGKMGYQYLQANGISSDNLVILISVAITNVQKKIQMQVSALDQKILSQKQQLITSVFLDQVSILWPGAKLTIFYDDHNFIIMEPKVKNVCLIDPYAAISFSVKKQQQQLQDNQECSQMSEQNNQIQLLVKSVNKQSKHLGYDCSVFMQQKQFNQMTKILKLQEKQVNHIWIKINSSLPFTKGPTLEEFISYTQIQKNNKPILSQFLVKIVKRKNQNMQQSVKEDQLQFQEDNQFNISCSQLCKQTANFPQKCFFTKQNIFQINETKTLDIFLMQIQKYQIHLSQINLKNKQSIFKKKSLQQEIRLKQYLSSIIVDAIFKEGQFLFLQNYYPFIIQNKCYEMKLIPKSQNSKRVLNSNFILIKNPNKDIQQEEISFSQRQQIINKLTLSIKTFQIQQIQKLEHPDWIPFIKQISEQCNQDDIQFSNVFQTSYKNQLIQINQLISSKNIFKLLITTYSANGKTYLYSYLSSKCNFRSWYIDMRQLNSTNNKFDQINNYLEIFIASCPYEFVYFDNIDFFLPNIQNGDQMRQKQKIISHVFSLKLFQILEKNQKSAIFTAKSEVSIINNISFDKIVKLKNPNRKTRAQILNKIGHNQVRFQQQLNFNQFVDKTQSFSLGAFNSYLRQRMIPVKHQSKIRKNDFSKIVGLSQAKNMIKSVIQKPNKFGFIYQKVKIKVPRGILLYGATGNGKTALGCAIQDEFPMKFFTVKGSDILSKYIGGSEAAVRDIFQKALSVSPSVIFFDQFESIVPRRNSSGTGVTDRVVNQFLCYLDGVSSTTGVFIVAASSRPDLIDPALLRPGRIDSHMYLQYPNNQQRRELLDLFSSSVNINHDYEQIVEDTKNFSYSDLIGFLKELRIKQSSIVLKQFKQSQDTLQKDSFRNITKELYLNTLKTFRIGTDLEQQQKQNQLYQRFKMGKGPQVKKQKFIQM